METGAEEFGLTADELWYSNACRALGHPARLRIVKTLAAGRCICGHIVDVLPLAQSTVSQHLKVLRQAGLVRAEVEGLANCYCIDPAQLKRFRDVALSICGQDNQSPGA